MKNKGKICTHRTWMLVPCHKMNQFCNLNRGKHNHFPKKTNLHEKSKKNGIMSSKQPSFGTHMMWKATYECHHCRKVTDVVNRAKGKTNTCLASNACDAARLTLRNPRLIFLTEISNFFHTCNLNVICFD